MNIANVKEAIRLLKAQPEQKFNMDIYFGSIDMDDHNDSGSLAAAIQLWDAHPCNTVVCLAGLIQMHKATDENSKYQDALQFAQDWLGIDYGTAEWLFLPTFYIRIEEKITKTQVLARLRTLIARAREH